jgi:protein-tyrosine phosphatase
VKRRRRPIWLWLALVTLIFWLPVGLFLAAIEHWAREPENYSLIEEGLYMGGHVSRPPRGATAVVNLCEIEDPYQEEYHLWAPINDSDPGPDIDTLRQLVEFIDVQRQAGRTTFVHCLHGVSRSGMVTAAYLMWKNGWTRDEALEFIKSRRPETRPSPPLMHRLLEWEHELQSSAAAD